MMPIRTFWGLNLKKHINRELRKKEHVGKRPTIQEEEAFCLWKIQPKSIPSSFPPTVLQKKKN